MPALKAVSQHLEAAEAEAEAKLQQVSPLLNNSSPYFHHSLEELVHVCQPIVYPVCVCV